MNDYTEYGNYCTKLGLHTMCKAANLQSLVSGLKNNHNYDISDKCSAFIKDRDPNKPIFCDVVWCWGDGITDVIFYENESSRDLTVAAYLKMKGIDNEAKTRAIDMASDICVDILQSIKDIKFTPDNFMKNVFRVDKKAQRKKEKKKKNNYKQLLYYLLYCDRQYNEQENDVDEWLKKEPNISNVWGFIINFNILATIRGFLDLSTIYCLRYGNEVYINIDTETFDFEIHRADGVKI